MSCRILKWGPGHMFHYLVNQLVFFLLNDHTGIPSNLQSPTLGDKIVDHSDIFGASPVGTAPTVQLHLILDLTPGFSGLGKDNCKTRRETYKFWDLVHFILKVWRYISLAQATLQCLYKTISEACHLAAITGTNILVPYLQVKSQQLIGNWVPGVQGSFCVPSQ